MSNILYFPKPFEPKKQNRFTIKFGEPFEIPEWVTYKTSRPVLNRQLKWEKMVFSMYDPIGPSTSQVVMKGIQKLKEKNRNVIDVTLNSYGPIGDKIEEWLINGSICKIDFGKLDWKNDELLLINLHLDVINVELNY